MAKIVKIIEVTVLTEEPSGDYSHALDYLVASIHNVVDELPPVYADKLKVDVYSA